MFKSLRNRTVLLVSLLILGFIGVHLVQTELEDRNIAHAREWLEACPPQEMRAVYFEQNDPKIQAVQEIDLAKRSWWKGTYYAGGADSWKGMETHPFTPAEFQEVERLLNKLPTSGMSSYGTPSLPERLSIAVNLNGRLQITRYPLKSLSSEVQQLYKILGSSSGIPK